MNLTTTMTTNDNPKSRPQKKMVEKPSKRSLINTNTLQEKTMTKTSKPRLKRDNNPRLEALKKQWRKLRRIEQQLAAQEVAFAKQLQSLEARLGAAINSKLKELSARAEALENMEQEQKARQKSELAVPTGLAQSPLATQEAETKPEHGEQLTITVQKVVIGEKTYYCLPTLPVQTPDTPTLDTSLSAPPEAPIKQVAKTPAAELEEITADPEERLSGSSTSSPPETPNVVTETDFAARHERLLSSEEWFHTLVNMLTSPKTTPEPIDTVTGKSLGQMGEKASSAILPLAPLLSSLAKSSTPLTALQDLFPSKNSGSSTLFFSFSKTLLEPETAPALGAEIPTPPILTSPTPASTVSTSLASTFSASPTPTPVAEYVSLRKSPLKWLHTNRKTIASVVTSGFVGFLTAYSSRALVTGPIAQQSTALQARSIEIQEAGLDPFRNLRDELIEKDTCRSGRAYLMIRQKYPEFAEKAPSHQLEVLGLDPKIRRNIDVLAAGKQLPLEAGRCNLFK
jgi:hypothetical protein